jgi:hypothetical protein
MGLTSFIVDDRVPPNELWFFTSGPAYIVTPNGCTVLRIPDGKIVNIGEPKSKLDWVIAPH